MISKEKKAIFGLSLGHFNVDLNSALLVALYPLITIKLGINLATISSFIALSHLCSSLMQPFFGYLSDKITKRAFMVGGLILSSIFTPFAIKTKTVGAFLICLLLGMIGNALFHPQVGALIKEFNKNNPKLVQSMGIFLGLGTIGYAIGPYLGSFCFDHFGENSLLFFSLIGLFSTTFIYFFVPKKPKNEFTIEKNFLLITKEILKNKVCRFLIIISIIKSAVSISFGTYIPFLLHQNGFNISSSGLIVTLFFIAGGLATICSSKLEKRIKAKNIIVLSFTTILPLTLLFLYFLKYNKFLSIGFFILSGFFILLSVGVLLIEAQKAIPKYTGVISGIMQGFSWGIGALFLSPLGYIGQIYGIDKILISMSLIAFITGIYTAINKNI